MAALGRTGWPSRDECWPSGAMVGVHCGVLALVACAAAGVDLGGSASLAIASVGIAIFGLPHGALDIALIRRSGGGSTASMAVILAVYIAVGLSMAALWWIGPTVALVAFLGIAVVHFAEDWTETGSPFLATGLALAIISAPALLHRADVGAIFAALTGTSDAGRLRDVLLLAAPIAGAVAVAGIAALIAARRFDRAAAAAASLAATIALPPALGFAIFFAAFHSPRHIAGALRALALPRARQWIPVAAPAMLGVVGLVAIVYRLNDGGVAPAMGLTSATFMALSILTIPHMAVPRLMSALERGRSPRP